MMEKVKVPIDITDDIKCDLCGEFLSYPPIKLYAETGSVCGRCPQLEAELNIQPVRNNKYEVLAEKFLLFPCLYRPLGCFEYLPMSTVPLHESRCLFKPYFCPVLPLGSCPWQGLPDELHMHFANEHAEFLLKSNIFEPDLIHHMATNMLLPSLNGVFLIHTAYNEDHSTFYCSAQEIYTEENNCTFSYCLTFKDANNECNTWELGSKVVLLKDTDLKQTGCEVSVHELKTKLNNPLNITCDIDITVCKRQETVSVVNLSLNDSNIEMNETCAMPQNTIMSDIECPVCQEYMVPPIYQCIAGHSFCGICRPKLQECPSCRCQVGNTRNYTLEKITSNLKYPCKYQPDGCTFHAIHNNIRQHETECRFSPIHCIFEEYLQCKWRGAESLLKSHIQESHSDKLVPTPPVMVNARYSPEGESEIQVVTLTFGQIFRIYFSYNNEKKKVYATVQHVGLSSEAEKYLYEVNFIDTNTKFMQLMSKKLVGNINSRKSDIKHCSIWPLEMVLPFESQDNDFLLMYKLFKK